MAVSFELNLDLVMKDSLFGYSIEEDFVYTSYQEVGPLLM
jgi:hypothetical protein